MSEVDRRRGCLLAGLVQIDEREARRAGSSALRPLAETESGRITIRTQAHPAFTLIPTSYSIYQMASFMISAVKYLGMAALGSTVGLATLLYATQTRLIYPANMPKGRQIHQSQLAACCFGICHSWPSAM